MRGNSTSRPVSAPRRSPEPSISRQRYVRCRLEPGRSEGNAEQLARLVMNSEIAPAALHLLLWLLAAALACSVRGTRTQLQQPVGRTHTVVSLAPGPDRGRPPGREEGDSGAQPGQVRDTAAPSSPVSAPERLCDLPDTPAEALLFASDDTSLRERGTQILDDLLACMDFGLLGGKRLLVVGFTDPRGPPSHNYLLGLERARSVQRYLVRRGVDPSRITIASRGEELARGSGPETWMFDRRVEISLLR